MATTTHGIRRGRRPRHAPRAQLQLLLERERQVLGARRKALRGSARGEMRETTDVEERSEEQVDFGVGLASLSLSARTVQSIEAALKRFGAGTYGACLDCDGRIEPARLGAMPFAELCRGCQEHHGGSRGEPLRAV